MRVLKFGGTSVGSAERIRSVARLVSTRGRNLVVLSAMAGTTNALVEIASLIKENQINAAASALDALKEKYAVVVADLLGDDRGYAAMAREAVKGSFDTIRNYFGTKRFTDVDERTILAQGELISTALMACYLRSQGVNVALLPALDFMLVDHNNQPLPGFIADSLNGLIEANSDAELFLTQGFICRNSRGEIDNLQRGGSDFTATLAGCAINAEEVEIWTDIDGMHTGDPRFVDGTRRVESLTFDEASELAYFGAKILHPMCIWPARSARVPVRLLNTLDPLAEGTVIGLDDNPDGTLKAVAAKDDIIMIKVTGNRLIPPRSFFGKVFASLELCNINVDISVISEVSVALALGDGQPMIDSLLEKLSRLGKVAVEKGQVIISVVGDFSSENAGEYRGDIMEALSQFNVKMICNGASDSSLSVIVDNKDKIMALNNLNTKLFN